MTATTPGRRPAPQGRSPVPGDASSAGGGDDPRVTRPMTDPSTKEPLVSTQIPPRPLTSPYQRESPWVSGLTVVAAIFLVLPGVWHTLAGFGGVVRDDVYVATMQ